MTYRALELLNLPPDEPAFLLDIGCGSGLSGEILDEEGYLWVGVDIAPSMLGEYSDLWCVTDGAEAERWKRSRSSGRSCGTSFSSWARMARPTRSGFFICCSEAIVIVVRQPLRRG